MRGGNVMTEEQKKIKRYVNQLERHLRLPLELKVRINGDIGTEIHQRLDSGQSLEQAFKEMGSPVEVAERFNQEFADNEVRKNPVRFLFLILAGLVVVGELGYIWALGQMENTAERLNRIFLNPVEFGCGSVIAIAGFAAGCIAAYFLALYGRKETYTRYIKCIVLSTAGLAVGLIAACIPESTGAIQWTVPLGMSSLTIEPGLMINVVALILSYKFFIDAKYTKKDGKNLDK